MVLKGFFITVMPLKNQAFFFFWSKESVKSSSSMAVKESTFIFKSVSLWQQLIYIYLKYITLFSKTCLWADGLCVCVLP